MSMDGSLKALCAFKACAAPVDMHNHRGRLAPAALRSLHEVLLPYLVTHSTPGHRHHTITAVCRRQAPAALLTLHQVLLPYLVTHSTPGHRQHNHCSMQTAGTCCLAVTTSGTSTIPGHRQHTWSQTAHLVTDSTITAVCRRHAPAALRSLHQVLPPHMVTDRL